MAQNLSELGSSPLPWHSCRPDWSPASGRESRTNDRPSRREMISATLYEAHKSARQFANPVGLLSANGVLGNQFAVDPEGDGTRKNIAECILLVYAPGGDQRKARKHQVKGSNIGLTADLAARHDLNEVDTFFPSRNDFSRSEGSRKHNNLVLYGKFDESPDGAHRS